MAPPVATFAVVGDTVTTIAGPAVIVTAVEPDLVVSCTLVAVTVTDWAVAGAVRIPLVETLPADAVHVTAFEKVPVPATAAVHCEVVLV